MDKNLYKSCPRCNEKLMITANKCVRCGFNYAKLLKATNQGAKEQIKAGNRHNVIYVTERPNDIPKKNFLILFWLFGWTGVHNLYIGKYRKGICHLAVLLAFVISFAIYFPMFQAGMNVTWIYYYIAGPLSTIYAFFLMSYIFDVVALVFRKFKYPVSIPIKDTIEDTIKEK